MCTYLKTIIIQLSENELHQYHIIETVSESLSIFTWPCAYILAAFISINKHFILDKTVIELGAGTGLPSLIAFKCGAKRVILTERVDSPTASHLLQMTIDINNASSKCDVREFSWTTSSYVTLPVPDVILGSDIFYSSEDFDGIFSTIAGMFKCNPNAIFIVTYQVRSIHRTIIPYLDLYHLTVETIPLETFMHPVHYEGAVNIFIPDSMLNDISSPISKRAKISGCSNTLALSDEIGIRDGSLTDLNYQNSVVRILPTLDSLYLLIIRSDSNL